MRVGLSRLSAAVPCLLLACAGPSLILLATAQTSVDGLRILPHVTIAGVDVGGLTAEEALLRLSERVAQQLSKEITLVAPEHRYVLPLRDLGGQVDLKGAVEGALAVGRGESTPRALREAVDTILGSYEVPLPVVIDQRRAQAVLQSILAEVRREPCDARAEVIDGELVIEPHVVGLEPDLEATLRNMIRAIEEGSLETPIVLREIPPQVLTESLEDLELLASFTTHFSTGQVNRATNIRIAAALIDGTVVPPGAVFSVNQTTGPRTPDKGFRVAPVYSGQEVVYGVGGGVCQISTTIYNAVLEAGLKVVERHQHSLPVHYVPWGRDATISYGAADFRFQNTSGGPVIVRTTVDGGYLTCSLLGRKSASTSNQGAERASQYQPAPPPQPAIPASDEPRTRGQSPYRPTPSAASRE